MIVNFISEQLQDFWLLLIPLVKNHATVSSKLSSALLHLVSIGKYPDNLLWLVLSGIMPYFIGIIGLFRYWWFIFCMLENHA